MKINLCTLYRAALYNSLSIRTLNFLIFFQQFLTIFNCFRNFTIKPFLGSIFYTSFFNSNNNFLNKVIIGFSSVIKILVVKKFLKKISRVMLERLEFNMFVRASFNPKNFYCIKYELMVINNPTSITPGWVTLCG